MKPNPSNRLESLSNLEIVLTIMKISLPIIIMLLPLILLFSPARRWLTKHLMPLQNWLLARFNIPLLKPLNFRGHKWALVLTSLVVYLTSANAMGLLPFVPTPTARLSLSIGLVLPLWVATAIIGARKPPTPAFGHMMPRVNSNPLTPLYILMKAMGPYLRPLALGIRITANLTVGHLLIHLLSVGALALFTALSMTVALSATVLMLLTILEAVIVSVQAYVFVLLLSGYLQEDT